MNIFRKSMDNVMVYLCAAVLLHNLWSARVRTPFLCHRLKENNLAGPADIVLQGNGRILIAPIRGNILAVPPAISTFWIESSAYARTIV